MKQDEHNQYESLWSSDHLKRLLVTNCKSKNHTNDDRHAIKLSWRKFLLDQYAVTLIAEEHLIQSSSLFNRRFPMLILVL